MIQYDSDICPRSTTSGTASNSTASVANSTSSSSDSWSGASISPITQPTTMSFQTKQIIIGVVIGGTALLSIPLLVLPVIVFILVLIAPCLALSFCFYHKFKRDNKVDPMKQPTKKKQHGLDDDTDKEKDAPPTLVPHDPHVPVRQITVEPELFYAKEAETKRKL